jgi:hypothetical protein
MVLNPIINCSSEWRMSSTRLVITVNDEIFSLFQGEIRGAMLVVDSTQPKYDIDGDVRYLDGRSDGQLHFPTD